VRKGAGIFYLAILCLMAAPAWAQTGYYNDDQSGAASPDDAAASQSHTVIVTSIEKCYAQLGYAERMDIEQHFEKPYEECQRRLALKIKQQQQLKAGQVKNTNNAQGAGAANTNDPPPAKNPPEAAPAAPANEGSYYRVQKDPLTPAADK
jgi:hypothetical protein